MAVFAPQLQSTIAVEQPVQQARVGSALAGLASNLFARPPSSGSKPSSEERFGAAWTKFSKRLEDQGVIPEGQVFTPGTASLSQLRAFGALNPEFSDDVFTRAKTENNQTLQSIEAETKGRNAILESFYTSGEGQVASARVATLREEGKTSEADKLEATLFGDYIKRKADNSRLADLAKQTSDLTTLSNDAWSVNKTAIRDTADIASRGLGELLIALKSSPTGAFNLEEQQLGQIFTAFPNITIRTVTKDNFGEFAQQLRSEILRTQKLRVEGEVDFTLRDAPEGYESEVFKGLDTIVSWAEKDLDPSTIVNRAKSDGFIRMQQAGIPVGDIAAIELIAKDPTAQAALLNGYSADVISYLDAVKGTSQERLAAASAMSTQSMKDARTHFARLVNVYSGKSTEARPYPEVNMDTRLMGVRDNMLGLLDTHSQIDQRTGKPQRFNRAAWNQYFESNSADIVQIASQDSEFATDLGTSLANDIMLDVQKVKEITRDKGITISFDNGKMAFSVNKQELIDNGTILSDAEAADLERKAAAGDTLARQRLLDFATESSMDEDAYVKQVMGLEGFRKTSANLDDVNYKWNVLNQLGQVGASVKSTIEQELGGKPQDGMAVEEALPTAEDLGIKVNTSMKPLIGTMEGASKMTVKGADQRLNAVLNGPFQHMQRIFGKQVTINDALAKAGTTRENETPGSRHFHGDALDISLAGMSDADKLRLVDAALEAGFQGFGFGAGILHIDMGNRRSWAYGNTTFGGKPLSELQAKVAGSSVARPDLVPTENIGNGQTEEADPNEGAVSNFSIVDAAPTISIRPQARMEAEPATAEMPEQITPAEGAIPGDQGLARVANSPVFTRELQRFLQTLGVDPEQTFVVADLDELEQAQAQGRIKKGDKVLVGEGKEAFVVEIE